MTKKGFSITVRKQLSQEFQQIRKEKKLTISEIALKSSLSIQNIEEIENGKMVSFTKFKDLASFYGKIITFRLE